MSPQEIAEVIAREIACEPDCKARPTGCGCSIAAAEAVLNFIAFRARVQTIATPEEIASSKTMIGSTCPLCNGRGIDEYGATCLHCGGQGGPEFVPYEGQL